MPLDNPIPYFLQMAQARNQNQQDMNQNIAGIGQGLGGAMGGVGEIMKQRRQQQLMQKLVSAMQQQGAPQQGPALAPAGTPQPNLTQIPPGQPMSAGSNIGQDVQMPQPIPTQGPGQPSSGVGAPAQDNTQLIESLMMQLNPQGAMGRMPTPLQQSEIAKNNAQARRYLGGASAKPMATIYRNSKTGEMTDDAAEAVGPDWKTYNTSQGDVLGKLAGQTAGKERNEVTGRRANALERLIDVRQIDSLAKSTGITPAQRNLLQQNNVRANRVVLLAGRPMTWQEFDANVLTDVQGIMQGGVPHVDQLHNAAYPSWKKDYAEMKSYITSSPTDNVPAAYVNRVMDVVKGLQQIDNRYLEANAKFQSSMLGGTIRGGIKPFQKPIREMTDTLTSTGQSTGRLTPDQQAELDRLEAKYGGNP